MASAADILADPNYVNANEATKRAIFEKHIVADPAYADANDATKVAIQKRFGVVPSPHEMTAGEAFMQVPMGIYKGFKNVTDTLLKAGASALDTVAGTDTRATLDKTAAQQNSKYQQVYGDSAIAKAGETVGEVAATAPVGGLIAAPLKAVAPFVGPATRAIIKPVATSMESGGFRTGLAPGASKTAELTARAVGGAATGAGSAALIDPNGSAPGMGAIAGAVVPTLGAGLVKVGANFVGKAADLLRGTSAAEVAAAKLIRDTLGDQTPAALQVLKNARPGITPAQALQEAGFNVDPFMSLEAFAKSKDTSSFYRVLEDTQKAAQKAELAGIAGGGNQANALASRVEDKNALNAATAPLRETELAAANQAGQTRARLEPYIEQKRASEVSALQGQGKAATEAQQQANLNAAGKPGWLSSGDRVPEWQATAGDFGAIKAQRQAEHDFAQNIVGSLEDHGLKPLEVKPIIAAIDAKIADPNLYGQDAVRVLKALREDFAGTATNGVADARALYSLRKAGISQKVDSLLGPGADAAAKQKLTAQVLGAIKNPIDEAITKAGGTGWTDYLEKYAAGGHEIDQKKMAAIALSKFDSPDAFLKLVRGNDTKAVEKVFGYGSADVIKEMGTKAGVLEKVAREIERDKGVTAAAASGVGGLKRLMEQEQSIIHRLPMLLSRPVAIANMGINALEGKVKRETLQVLQEGFKSGASVAELAKKIPYSDRSAVLSMLKNSRVWSPDVSRAGVMLYASPKKNNLQSENKNNLN